MVMQQCVCMHYSSCNKEFMMCTCFQTLTDEENKDGVDGICPNKKYTQIKAEQDLMCQSFQ